MIKKLFCVDNNTHKYKIKSCCFTTNPMTERERFKREEMTFPCCTVSNPYRVASCRNVRFSKRNLDAYVALCEIQGITIRCAQEQTVVSVQKNSTNLLFAIQSKHLESEKFALPQSPH